MNDRNNEIAAGLLVSWNYERDEVAVAALSDFVQEEDYPMLVDVGEKVLIRTVTHYYTGEVTEVTPFRIRLKDACWIPDTGRLSTALKNGELSEIEPYPNSKKAGYGVTVAVSACVDICPWDHALPREAK